VPTDLVFSSFICKNTSTSSRFQDVSPSSGTSLRSKLRRIRRRVFFANLHSGFTRFSYIKGYEVVAHQDGTKQPFLRKVLPYREGF